MFKINLYFIYNQKTLKKKYLYLFQLLNLTLEILSDFFKKQ